LSCSPIGARLGLSCFPVVAHLDEHSVAQPSLQKALSALLQQVEGPRCTVCACVSR
jgi:hypothetical protein